MRYLVEYTSVVHGDKIIVGYNSAQSAKHSADTFNSYDSKITAKYLGAEKK